MNQEALDRLLIDRALGVIQHDASELLDAYLDGNPEAATRARQFAEATDLATRALGGVGEAAVPPFPAALLAQAERARRRMRVITRAASMAACVLLGVAVGAWATRAATHDRSTPGSPAAARGLLGGDGSSGMINLRPDQVASAFSRTEHPLAVVHAGARADQGFWSLRRLYEEARKYPPPRPAPVEWVSPVREPRIGGAS